MKQPIKPQSRQFQSIKTWAAEDRPREKMLTKGKTALSDAELIAILLRSGSRKETAIDLARRILNDADNNLAHLSKLTIGQLTKYPGMGETKALSIAAALELGRRRREAEVKQEQSIRNSSDVFEYMQSVMSDLSHEQFWIILLNVKNTILARIPIGEGGVTSTIVDIKKIYRNVIDYNAVGLVLCHNHPSGNPLPSNADIELTRKISSAGKILEVKLIDHIIFGNEKYYSFADEGNIIEA